MGHWTPIKMTDTHNIYPYTNIERSLAYPILQYPHRKPIPCQIIRIHVCSGVLGVGDKRLDLEIVYVHNRIHESRNIFSDESYNVRVSENIRESNR